jgi:hypothetical protein
MNVPDETMLYLFAGVGIYNPSKIDNVYTNEIIDNTLNGTLAFTIATNEISYGMNSPIDSVIIDDDAIKSKSINTIFQLMARVGRPNLAWTAHVYIGPELEKRLQNYIYDREIECIEAKNIKETFKTKLENLKIKKNDNSKFYDKETENRNEIILNECKTRKQILEEYKNQNKMNNTWCVTKQIIAEHENIWCDEETKQNTQIQSKNAWHDEEIQQNVQKQPQNTWHDKEIKQNIQNKHCYVWHNEEKQKNTQKSILQKHISKSNEQHELIIKPKIDSTTKFVPRCKKT